MLSYTELSVWYYRLNRIMVTRSSLVIFCCALGGHAVNLIPFSYGMFLPYVYSYLYEEDSSTTTAMMHVHAPLCLTIATGTAWTFGIFQKYIDPLILHVFNGLGLSLWMVVLYKFGDSYLVITIAIGIIGFHAGQLHVYFSQRVTEEGKRYPSTANGVYGFFFGLAGIWGNIMSGAFINPWSIQPDLCNDTYVFDDPRILERVPENWIILGIIMLVLLLPGYFVIWRTDDENDEEKDKLIQSRRDEEGSTEECLGGNEQSIFSMTGLTLFLTTIGIGVSSMCAFDLFKDYGLKKIHDDYFLNIAGMMIPVVGAIGRVLWGTLGDKVSLKKLFVGGNVFSCVLQMLMYPARANKFTYVINACILSVMPGMMTLLPPSVKKFMGTSNIALKYGIVLTGEVIGCMYYLTLTFLLRAYLNDLVLVILAGIPAALAIIPTVLFIKDNHDTVAR